MTELEYRLFLLRLDEACNRERTAAADIADAMQRISEAAAHSADVMIDAFGPLLVALDASG